MGLLDRLTGNKLPTLKDVARRVAVSVLAASVVLSDKAEERIATLIVDRVLLSAPDLGYRRNWIARFCCSSSRHCLACEHWGRDPPVRGHRA